MAHNTETKPNFPPEYYTDDDPFLHHIHLRLASCDLGNQAPPVWDGVSNWRQDQIFRTIAELGQRLWSAEEQTRRSQVTEYDLEVTPPFPGFVSVGKPLSYASSSVHRSVLKTSTGSEPTKEPSVASDEAGFKNGTNPADELSSLKAQIRDIAKVVNALAKGDLSQKVTIPVDGAVMVELKDVVNWMADTGNQFVIEVNRVSQEARIKGKLSTQALLPLGLEGSWRELIDNINFMIRNLASQIEAITAVATAVANGDLTQKISGVSVSGEMSNLVTATNDMIDKLVLFTTEAVNVAKEVGIEGKLGLQVEVGDMQGIWQEVALSINELIRKLAVQVRGFAQIAAAAMGGDPTRFIHVKSSGGQEMDPLKNQISLIISHLAESINKSHSAKEAVELALKNKSEIYASNSKEIRTTMDEIIGSIELISDTGLNEAKKQGLLSLAKSVLVTLDKDPPTVSESAPAGYN